MPGPPGWRAGDCPRKGHPWEVFDGMEMICYVMTRIVYIYISRYVYYDIYIYIYIWLFVYIFIYTQYNDDVWNMTYMYIHRTYSMISYIYLCFLPVGMGEVSYDSTYVGMSQMLVYVKSGTQFWPICMYYNIHISIYHIVWLWLYMMVLLFGICLLDKI